MAPPNLGTGDKRKRVVRETKPRKSQKIYTAPQPEQNETPSLPDVKQLEDGILDSQRHLNNIVTLVQLLKKDVKLSNSSSPALLALCRIFCRFHADGRFLKSSISSENARLVAIWIQKRYSEYKVILLDVLRKPDSDLREISLKVALELLQEEFSSASNTEVVWKSGFFHQLLDVLFHLQVQDRLLDNFVDCYICPYDDVRHYTLQAIGNMTNIEGQYDESVLIANILKILPKVSAQPTVETKSHRLYISSNKLPSSNAQRKQAQKAWMTILRTRLDEEQRKIVLGYMTYRVLPWFQDVELLMDFLTDSFNYGGNMSLLALSGMFHLMQEKNLDYPDFYVKLYSLLDDNLLFSRHRSRFFRLFDTFMSSTHLPAALVASFIKKLSRLALYGSPGGIVAVIPWIYNTLKNHTACTFMIHRELQTSEAREEFTQSVHDPFDFTEKDPMYTCAIESSLWELDTLQSHYHPNVASLTKIISEQFTKSSYQIEDFLDHSYNSLAESELVRDLKKDPVVEHEIPKTVFSQSGDNNIWSEVLNNIMI